MTRLKRHVTAAVIVSLTGFAVPLSYAHHTGAMFDKSKQLTVSGTVQALEWSNPHIWLWLSAPNNDEEPILYAFEGASVGEMMRRNGWTKDSVKAGDQIVVKYAPFRDGKNGGDILQVTLPTGVTLGASE